MNYFVIFPCLFYHHVIVKIAHELQEYADVYWWKSNYLFHPQCFWYVRARSKENIIKTIYRWELQFSPTYESVTYLLGIKSNSTQLKKLHTSFSIIQYSAQMYLAWSSYNILDFTLNKTSLDIIALSLKGFYCNSTSNSKKQCKNRFIRTM